MLLLWSKYDTEAEIHVANTYGKVIWPCDANRDEHASKKKSARQHTRLFATK